jgi:hypothetical protein
MRAIAIPRIRRFMSGPAYGMIRARLRMTPPLFSRAADSIFMGELAV